jgi:hypothetical protein
MNLRKLCLFRSLLGAGVVASSVVFTAAAQAHPPLRPYLRAGWFGRPIAPCGPLHTPCPPIATIDPCGPCAPAIVSSQAIPQIHYQRQAVIQQVPVTSYQQVTVDEGSYQMVWVPRPVTRTVAQTFLQPQIAHRDVAIQTHQIVAQIQTPLAPYGVAYTTPETPLLGWNVGSGLLVAPLIPGTPMIATQPIERPTPHPDYLSTPPAAVAPGTDEWQTIPQRQSTLPAEQAPQASQTPTAARVWQSQLHSHTVTR